MAPSSHHPVAILRAVLAEIGWDPQGDVQGNSLFVDLEVEDVPISHAHAVVFEELEQFVFYLTFNLAPAVAQRDECAVLIARINHEILVGSFDLDVETGRFCFKYGVSYRGDVLRAQQIRNAILGSMQAVELYADVIVAVADGQSSQDALRQWQSAHPEGNHRPPE